MQ
ncbi:unnamed protein product [Linum tenue]|jgi:hypothetical protein